MERVDAAEFLDDSSLPQDVAARAYRDLARLHRWLGNTAAVLNRLRDSSLSSVLDLGCGHGLLLEEIRQQLKVEVTGLDLRPAPASSSIRILAGNAIVDELPAADVATAICLVHHLSENEIIRLIRNVSRSCRRLIILDPVRHWLPLCLFRIFVSPFLGHINVADGITSIRRSYTPGELRNLVDTAVQGTEARVGHSVAPFYIRQIIDISWS